MFNPVSLTQLEAGLFPPIATTLFPWPVSIICERSTSQLLLVVSKKKKVGWKNTRCLARMGDSRRYLSCEDQHSRRAQQYTWIRRWYSEPSSGQYTCTSSRSGLPQCLHNGRAPNFTVGYKSFHSEEKRLPTKMEKAFVCPYRIASYLIFVRRKFHVRTFLVTYT